MCGSISCTIFLLVAALTRVDACNSTAHRAARAQTGAGATLTSIEPVVTNSAAKTDVSVKPDASASAAASASLAAVSFRCEFAVQPQTPTVWDPTCEEGILGCKADGINVGCRFCGEEPYDPCPPCGPVYNPCPVCEFPVEPATRYVWDRNCHPEVYTNGCNADGIHFECRFCGEADFDPCPSSTSTSTEPPARTASTWTATTPGASTTSSIAQDVSSGAVAESTSLRGTDAPSKSSTAWHCPELLAYAVSLALIAVHLTS